MGGGVVDTGGAYIMDPQLDLCKKSYGRTFNCLVSKILFQKVQFSFQMSIDVGLRTFSKNSQKLAVLNLMPLRKLSDTAFPLLFHRRRKKRTPSLQVHNFLNSKERFASTKEGIHINFHIWSIFFICTWIKMCNL